MADVHESVHGALESGLPRDRDVWLIMLLAQTGSQLWSVDIAARTLRVITVGGTSNREVVYENFPDSYLESGHVHPSSRAAFRAFSLDLLSGKVAGVENFTLQYRETSCYGWARLSYRMIFDDKGRPVRAVGLRSNLSYRSSGEAGFLQRRPAPENLFPHLFANVQADLTNDFVERLEIKDVDASELEGYGSYSEVVSFVAGRLFSRADERPFYETFSCERLIAAFESGRRWQAATFRLVDNAGAIRRLHVGANMVRNSETGDVLLFAYVSDAEQRHWWAAGPESGEPRDEVTGLVDEGAISNLARRQIALANGGSCALALVWTEGDLGAGAPEDETARIRRRDIATALTVAFDTDCILGQHGQDMTAVFFPEASSQQELQRRIERAISFVRLSLDDEPDTSTLRFVTGVVRCACKDADFDAMLAQAESLCRLYGGEAADIVVFPDVREERQRSAASMGAAGSTVVPAPLRKGRSLTTKEKDVAIACLTGMLSAQSFEESVASFLGSVGSHYHADRAYLLTLTRVDRTIAVPYEWCAEGKYGIGQVISGKNIAQYPLLARSADAEAPELLARARTLEGGLDGGSASPPAWRFVVYPLHEENGVRWTLNLENPQGAPADTALLDALVPILESERVRFGRDGTSGGAARDSAIGRLMGLPNLSSFMDVVYSLSSDVYNSMGALAVDIPDLESISEGEGFEHSMRLILRVSEVLGDVFGQGMLFHTRDSEFVVLSPDTIYEVFVDRCARARQLLQASCPDQFRFGYTWSDSPFSAQTLVREARAIMGFDDVSARRGAQSLGEQAAAASSLPTSRLAKGERFEVYFQPKVDLRSGLVVGAEALARVVGEDGIALPPTGLIEVMERESTIRDLDYFVFDSTLAIMDGWARRRRRMIPVSTNFSRNTLLGSSSFASVMAIMSRYPDVPHAMIEMEVTETACNVERATLGDIVRNFHELGVRLGLDDFGSDYSNLAVLANVPFDEVKLDRSLVKDIVDNDVARMIVRNIVQVCTSRKTLCVAEGVETEEQVEALIDEGCACAQGYYFSKPIPAAEFELKYLHGRGTA